MLAIGLIMKLACYNEIARIFSLVLYSRRLGSSENLISWVALTFSLSRKIITFDWKNTTINVSIINDKMPPKTVVKLS